MPHPIALLLSLLLVHHSLSAAHPATDSPLVQFGLEEFRKTGFYETSGQVSLVLDPKIEAQAYHIQKPDIEKPARIKASDERGFMYGLLELAEQYQLHGIDAQVDDITGSPYINKRGLKFNIPLDARTPSYDDSGDAAQRNIAEMWNMEFWTEFLDQMARDRYNMLSLWNPHPFPSMITLEDFPEVALDDVCITTLTPNGRENEWGEPQLVSSNIVQNLKVVKKIAIDKKIAFWQAVMSYAKDRGIDIYFITWNICANSVAQPVTPYYRTYDNAVTENEIHGKHGVTHEITNPATKRYFRAAMKQFVLTYPDLSGFGITAGEHMPISSDLDREKWLWETYGLGIVDAKKEDPSRKITFMHRVWNSDFSKILPAWKDYPDTFELSFKYAKARLYSSPNMPFADQLVADMKPHGLKSWWNLRNDDLYVHRWGDPDYVRAFLQNFDLDATAGYHMGSDGYVWGREFVSKNGKSPRELEIHKHWYNFMMWGRLGYDPNLDTSFFEAKLAQRFPSTNSPSLFNTWQTASKIVPLVNRFYWRNWDHMWSPENSNSHVEGYHGIERFCDNQPMQGSGIQKIRAFIDARLEGKTIEGDTPLQVANQLSDWAAIARDQAALQKAETQDRDLIATLDDCIGMSWLGEYYAQKILAATALAAFQKTGAQAHKDEAIKHAQSSYEACTRYTDHSQARYHSQMLARSGLFDWSALLTSARRDVSIVKNYPFNR